MPEILFALPLDRQRYPDSVSPAAAAYFYAIRIRGKMLRQGIFKPPLVIDIAI